MMAKDLSSGTLLQQIVAYARKSPAKTARYGFATLYGAAAFALRAGDTHTSLIYRVRLLATLLKINFRVPGAVTLLECIWLVETALAVHRRGDWIEVGAYKGRSTACLSLIAAQKSLRLWVVDTFAGLPVDGGAPYTRTRDGKVEEYYFEQGEYMASEIEFTQNIHEYGCETAVDVVKADIGALRELSDSFKPTLSFAFLDVDLAKSYEDSIRFISSHIDQTAVLVLHEGQLDPVRTMIQSAAFWRQYALEVSAIKTYDGILGVSSHMIALTVERTDAD